MSFKTLTAAFATTLFTTLPLLAESNIQDFGGGFHVNLDVPNAKAIQCFGEKLILEGAGGTVRGLGVEDPEWKNNEMLVVVASHQRATLICLEGTLRVLTYEPTDIVYIKVGGGVFIHYGAE